MASGQKDGISHVSHTVTPSRNPKRSKIEVPRGSGILMRSFKKEGTHQNRIAEIDSVSPRKFLEKLARIETHLNNGITSDPIFVTR